MTLPEAVDAHVDRRRARGAKFVTGAETLHLFRTRAGGGIDCNAVGEADVPGFLAGNGLLTESRADRCGALAGVPALRDQPRPCRPLAASRAR